IVTLWDFVGRVKWLGQAARRLGCIEASLNEGVEALRRNQLLLIFPEGEEGSFKPSSEAYRLREFRTGFVRMALLTGAPVVPCLVIGAEETHICLGRLRFRLPGGKKKSSLPVPLNWLPLPARWRIRFLKPIHFP